MAVKKIGLPTEVLSLAEAREHLRLVPFGDPLAHPDDAYITSLISAAREWSEEYTGIAIGAQEYELALDKFPEEIMIAPYAQIINSIMYIDPSENEQTLNASLYALDNYSRPSWVLPSYGNEWPDTLDSANAVKVRYISGFTDGLVTNDNPCPKTIVQAMFLLIGSWYENRQQDVMSNNKNTLNQLPSGVFSLLQPYRINMGV